MEILINSKLTNIPEGATLFDSLAKVGIQDQGGMAVAINKEVIPRDLWNQKALNPGDKLTILRAVQGG